jgi:hypothetical protein
MADIETPIFLHTSVKDMKFLRAVKGHMWWDLANMQMCMQSLDENTETRRHCLNETLPYWFLMADEQEQEVTEVQSLLGCSAM